MRASTRGEPVLVMVGSRKLELLREALGERAARGPLRRHGGRGPQPRPHHPGLGRFVADQSPGAAGGMRGIGEPIWADRKPDELVECQLHESLINLAFAAADDVPPDLPVRHRRAARPRDRRGAPEPPGRLDDGRHGDVRRLLRASRRWRRASRSRWPSRRRTPRSSRSRSTACATRAGSSARRAEEAGLGERADDFVLAVNEVLSNSLYHAHDDGALRIWHDARRARLRGPRQRAHRPAADRPRGARHRSGRRARHLAREPGLRPGPGALIRGRQHRPDEDEPHRPLARKLSRGRSAADDCRPDPALRSLPAALDQRPLGNPDEVDDAAVGE